MLLSSRDVAELLKVSVKSVHRYRNSGLLAHVKVGGNVRFTLSQVEDFLKVGK